MGRDILRLMEKDHHKEIYIKECIERCTEKCMERYIYRVVHRVEILRADLCPISTYNSSGTAAPSR